MEVVHGDEEVWWIGCNLATWYGTVGDLPSEASKANNETNDESTEDALNENKV